MDIRNIFENFASDFEMAIDDDDWTRLEKYFADDASYINVGAPDPKCIGREAIIAYLKADVADYDRRFDSRSLVALTSPVVEGNRLSRKWRCIYSLTGVPDLVVEGEARYQFEGNLIKILEEEVTSDSMQEISKWMQRYAEGLDF